MSLLHPDDDTLVTCPACDARSTTCSRCDGQGWVSIVTLNDEERLFAGLLPSFTPQWDEPSLEDPS